MMKLLTAFLFSFTASAALNDVDKAMVWPKNVLPNGGFENGRQGWTVSGGTLATVTSGSNLLTGTVSATWDSNGAAQTMRTASIAIPKGLYGKNGVLACKTQVPSGTATTTMNVDDGTNDLATARTIQTTTTPVYNYLNFIFPSSGNIRITFTSVAADEPTIVFDDCFLGDAEEVNLTNISQAVFIGSAYFAPTTNCQWTTTSASIAAFGTDTDCPGPTVSSNPGPGTIQTTDANLPQITVNNLPPGTYRVVVSAFAGQTVGAANPVFALSDGAITVGRGYGASAVGTSGQVAVEGVFTYTSTANRTFALYASVNSGTLNLYNVSSNIETWFHVYRMPTTSEQAYRPSTIPFLWTGYHDSTCSWAYSATTLASPSGDASCALVTSYSANAGTITTAAESGNAQPGLVFTAPNVGVYEVCASFVVTATNDRAAGFILTNGVSNSTSYAEAVLTIHNTYIDTLSLCGWYVATSANTTFYPFIRGDASSSSMTIAANTTYSNNKGVDWQIRFLSQNIPSPLLTGSVTSSSTGAVRSEVANINCDAGSAITSQLGSWVSSIGNISGGACTVTLSSGAFSAAPYCVATPNAAFASTGLILSAASASATSVSVDCEDDASGACSAFDANLLCFGSK